MATSSKKFDTTQVLEHAILRHSQLQSNDPFASSPVPDEEIQEVSTVIAILENMLSAVERIERAAKNAPAEYYVDAEHRTMVFNTLNGILYDLGDTDHASKPKTLANVECETSAKRYSVNSSYLEDILLTFHVAVHHLLALYVLDNASIDMAGGYHKRGSLGVYASTLQALGYENLTSSTQKSNICVPLTKHKVKGK